MGRPKHQRIMPGGALEGEELHQKRQSSITTKSSQSSNVAAGGVTSYFVGRKLDEHRGAFILDHPMERGCVVDGGWDAMELLWEVKLQFCYYYYLLSFFECITCLSFFYQQHIFLHVFSSFFYTYTYI